MSLNGSRWLGISLAAFVCLALASQLTAQEEKKKRDRVEGVVHMINKDTSVITITTVDNHRRQVVYSKDTRYTLQNQKASFDDLKEGRRIIAVGKFDGEGRLLAKRIEVRTEN